MTRIGDRLGPRGGAVSKQKQQRGQNRRPYDRPSMEMGNVDGHWTHDKFRDTSTRDDTNRRGGAKVSGTVPGAAQVRVSNLHPAASAEDIRTIFSPFGNILSVNMVPSLKGGDKGTQGALIVFSSKAGATAAINEFNGTLADGYILSVTEEPIGASIVGASRNPLIPQPSMDISSRRRPGGGLYSDRMVVEPGNRLGNVVSNAAREAAHSTTITSSRQYHQGSGASSKGRLASRLGPATHFSVTF